MFSVVACWSGLRWSLEQTAVVSTSEESAHIQIHTPKFLIAHNNIITILSQSCTSKLNVILYDIFSRAQADVNLPNSIARKQHNNKKKKRI
jgi:hypothetical protein